MRQSISGSNAIYGNFTVGSHFNALEGNDDRNNRSNFRVFNFRNYKRKGKKPFDNSLANGWERNIEAARKEGIWEQ